MREGLPKKRLEIEHLNAERPIAMVNNILSILILVAVNDMTFTSALYVTNDTQ